MSTVAATTIQPGYEPIPGYRLEEQIGSGGFGEVWRAEAPGGLHKAIKFVHGALNDRQATRELRSLERIKGVHHPFLLTLERFEVAAGRLVIVTELADGSLEDVFRRHRDRGSCGIPRAALLAYLHDAADALDYLHEKYQLQHLDVKPGNLLIVGGHVKVGDFGLLKDLRDVESSMVGGLTPIYAPPEVFDGRPSPTSDQYSLAVMYQELLTGTRPFTGRTIAQLATQHVHSAPNLEPLPPSDRPVIARSLEKNPTRRYRGCRELVEALRAAANRPTQPRSRGESPALGNHGDTWEIEGDTRTSTLIPSGRSHGPLVEDLPRLKTGYVVPQTMTSAHALLVAVGGTGAECLRRLRERIIASSGECPLDLHSVLIDTASESIDAVRLSESSGRLRPCTSIWIPLRTPTQYRDSGTKHLTSISRRWVYNVPRSGRTEGLRPLGRLALVDHGGEVLRKLSESVRELAAAAGNGTPRVYLVGSLGGGTGSGTSWDLVHLLRHLLDDHGLPQATVTPLLSSPALESSLREPLATAACHAALSEMHHFLLPGNSYPGDPGIGWPGVPAARSPLGDAYIVAARDASGQSPTPIEMINDYIWADSTAAGPLLHAARDADSGSDEESSMFEPALRSFGMIALESAEQIERPRFARAMATRMLHEWLGRPAEARELAAQLHNPLALRCGLDLATLVRGFWGPLPVEPESRMSVLADGLRQHAGLQPITPEKIEDWLHSAGSTAAITCDPGTAPATATGPTSGATSGPTSGATSGAAEVEAWIQAVRRELSLRLKDRQLDLTTALLCVNRISESIRAAAESYSSSGERHGVVADAAAAALRALAAQANAPAHATRELIGSAQEPGPALQFAAERLLALTESRLATLLSELAVGLATLVESLTDQAAQVAAAIQKLGEPRAAESSPTGESWAILPKSIRGRGDKMLEALHRAIASSLLAAPVWDTSRQIDGETIALATSSAARQVIEGALDAVASSSAAADKGTGEKATAESSAAGNSAVGDSATAGEQSAEEDSDPITRAVRAVRPPLLACGGQQRLLLLVGSEVERVALQGKVADAHGGTLSVAVIPGIAPLLIHEAQRIPLSRVLSQLAMTLGDDEQISARLQTRSDIRWNSSEAVH